MAVLIADTLKPMSQFPLVMAEDTYLKDGTTSLQAWIDAQTTTGGGGGGLYVVIDAETTPDQPTADKTLAEIKDAITASSVVVAELRKGGEKLYLYPTSVKDTSVVFAITQLAGDSLVTIEYTITNDGTGGDDQITSATDSKPLRDSLSNGQLDIVLVENNAGAYSTQGVFADTLDNLKTGERSVVFAVQDTNANINQIIPVINFINTEIVGAYCKVTNNTLSFVNVNWADDGTVTVTSSAMDIPVSTIHLTAGINPADSTVIDFYNAGTTQAPDFAQFSQSVSEGHPGFITLTYDTHPSVLTLVDLEADKATFSCSFVRDAKVVVYTIDWVSGNTPTFFVTELDASGIAVDQTITETSQNATSSAAVFQYVGNLATLETQAKDNSVNAINELKSLIDDVSDTLANLAIPIEIKSFTMTPNTAQYERGHTPVEVTLAWATSMEPETQSLKKGGQLIAGTDTVTVKTVQDTPNATTDTSYVLEVTLKESSARATKTISILPRVYWGPVEAPADYDSAWILALANSKLTKSTIGQYSVNATGNQYAYIAYPTSIGTITAAYIGGFKTELESVATIQHTNAYSYTEEYNIVRTYRAGLGDIVLDVRQF